MDRWLPLARFGCAVLGVALVAVGAALWWLPAGLMVGGGLLLIAGLAAEMRAR